MNQEKVYHTECLALTNAYTVPPLNKSSLKDKYTSEGLTWLKTGLAALVPFYLVLYFSYP